MTEKSIDQSRIDSRTPWEVLTGSVGLLEPIRRMSRPGQLLDAILAFGDAVGAPTTLIRLHRNPLCSGAAALRSKLKQSTLHPHLLIFAAHHLVDSAKATKDLVTDISSLLAFANALFPFPKLLVKSPPPEIQQSIARQEREVWRLPEYSRHLETEEFGIKDTDAMIRRLPGSFESGKR
jgi:hypothetical protein